ncbi:MAG: LacI family transcriptional regulator [Puniceicoccaceae bacterium]|nr:MAG: LacI family transcriptional regulator [Puniceicoccaceae bacterium]
MRLTRDRARLEARTYPVLWECPETLGRLVRTGGFGLLLNRMPPEGLAARFIDSVGVEDRSGGRSAAEVLARQWRCGRVAVLAGPRGDPRSERRVEGFLQVLPGAVVVHARSWEREAGLRVAGKVLEAAPDGIFCVNDRLAQALWEAAAGQGRAGLRVIGFDNAPVAEELGLTTIAIPWEEFVEEVAVRIGRRLDGDNGTARQVNLVPRILYR